MTLPLSQRHEHEVKLRLKGHHRQLLEALAATADIPVAVLARNILVSELDKVVGATDSVPRHKMIGRS